MGRKEITICGLALALMSTSVNAQEYPISQGSPNGKLGRQWVQDTPTVQETPLYQPVVKERVVYNIRAHEENGIITLSVDQRTYNDWHQDFLVVETAEQTLYRHKAPAAGWTFGLLSSTSCAIGIAGLVSAAVAGANSGKSYSCGDVDGNQDNCYTDNSDEVAKYAGIGVGSLAVGAGSSLLMQKIKPFDHVKTDKHRTVDVHRETLTRVVKSEEERAHPVPDVELKITSPYFTLPPWRGKLSTDNYGNATVQLQPSLPNFAFSVDQLATIDAAQQLGEVGYKPEVYLPLLQQAAVPVAYEVHVQTKGTDGINTEVTVPVKGYEIPQKALEKVVMGLQN